VPVTAKLSRKFYETLGDDIANELVEWFNQVDATYRADLLQINELNFSRFDAKLEQRIAQLDAKWDRKWNQFEAKLEKRLAQLEVKFEQRLAEFKLEVLGQLSQFRTDMEQRFEQLDSKWSDRLAGLDSRWTGRLAGLEARVEQLEVRIDQRAAETKAELMKWMFVYWAGTIVPLGGVIYLLVR